MIDAALLQQHQADIDCVDETAKWTALHYAVAGQKQSMVKQLLDAGAAADIAAPGGIRPLHLACAGPITTASTRSKICLAHFYDQQQLWKKAGPGSSAIVKLLLAAGETSVLSLCLPHTLHRVTCLVSTSRSHFLLSWSSRTLHD